MQVWYGITKQHGKKRISMRILSFIEAKRNVAQQSNLSVEIKDPVRHLKP